MRLRPHDTSSEGGRSSERYRRIAFTSAAALGSRVVGMAANLVTVPLTFRYLGPERYGLWMVITSIIAMMAFADLGIGNGVVNSVAEAYGTGDRKLAREYVASAFALLLGIAVILAALGAMAYPHISWQKVFNVKSPTVASEGAAAFLVLFVWFIVNLPLSVINRAQTGLQQAYLANVVSTGGNILSLISVLIAIEFRCGLPLLVFASTFGSIAAVFFNGWLLFREHPWLFPSSHSYRGNLALKVFKLGMMFFVLQCAVAVSYTSDNVVISQVLGVAAVAAYAVPQKLFSVVATLVAMGVGPMWPAYGEAIARGDSAWVLRAFQRSIRLVFLAVVPACTFLVVFGPWIVRMAMSKSLHVPMSVFIVLGLWSILSAALTPIALFLNGAGIMKQQMALAIITSVVNLGLSIFMTRRFGVIGVCLGSLITQLLITVPAYVIIIKSVSRKLSMPQ